MQDNDIAGELRAAATVLREAAKDATAAAVHPDMAEPLAALLDSVAERFEGAVGNPPSGYPLSYALQVARVINGGVR